MNTQDFLNFQQLCLSPIRCEEREIALKAWEKYKLSRQVSYWQKKHRISGKTQEGKSGVWTKGDYISCLTAPVIDLQEAQLTDVCVGYVDLRGALLDKVIFNQQDLPWTSLKGAKLEHASLKDVSLKEARLMETDLRSANLTNADLRGADLSGANLAGAVLKKTKLSGANLQGANLIGADLEGCDLDDARVYGVSAWDVQGRPKSSNNLIVTPVEFPNITADDIKVAQFIYLLLNNPFIRDVLDTVTKKVVLILGRFKPKRKAVLDALRNHLRTKNLVPILFDFEQPTQRDITETVSLLARMARFIIADLTDPASIPQELQAIVPDIAVPVCLILQKGHEPYSMSKDLKKYPWVLKPCQYSDLNDLLFKLDLSVINPAEKIRLDLLKNRADNDW